MQGRFIVLEGIDGAGTTTQTRLLADWLAAKDGYAPAGVATTREPSSGPVGRLLRELLQGAFAPTDGTTMALLFAADRTDHIHREVAPLLARGTHVISDRYYHSSLAYQGEEADGVLVDRLRTLVPKPSLTVVLDVPVALAAERRRLAARSHERYDDLDVQEKVAANYRRLVERLTADEPIVLVEGVGSPEEVLSRLIGEVEKRCFERA